MDIRNAAATTPSGQSIILRDIRHCSLDFIHALADEAPEADCADCRNDNPDCPACQGSGRCYVFNSN